MQPSFNHQEQQQQQQQLPSITRTNLYRKQELLLNGQLAGPKHQTGRLSLSGGREPFNGTDCVTSAAIKVRNLDKFNSRQEEDQEGQQAKRSGQVVSSRLSDNNQVGVLNGNSLPSFESKNLIINKKTVEEFASEQSKSRYPSAGSGAKLNSCARSADVASKVLDDDGTEYEYEDEDEDENVAAANRYNEAARESPIVVMSSQRDQATAWDAIWLQTKASSNKPNGVQYHPHPQPHRRRYRQSHDQPDAKLRMMSANESSGANANNFSLQVDKSLNTNTSSNNNNNTSKGSTSPHNLITPQTSTAAAATGSGYHSIGSTRSNADSSGFSSEASCRTINNSHSMYHQMSSFDSRQHQDQYLGGCVTPPPGSNAARRSIRSRLIEDLDRLERLAAAAAAAATGGRAAQTSPESLPAGSRLAGATTTFDHSTLCHDEFSSFIACEPRAKQNGPTTMYGKPQASLQDHYQGRLAVESDESPTGTHRASHYLASQSSGPTLVGVHECYVPAGPRADSVAVAPLPSQRYHNDLAELGGPTVLIQEHEEGTRNSDLDQFGEGHYEAQVDEYFSDESDQPPGSVECSLNSSATSDRVSGGEYADQMDCIETVASSNYSRPRVELGPEACNDEQTKEMDSCCRTNEDNLGKMLDVYLQRVESLLRLAKGDKSITLNDVFGGSQEILVSDEHHTQIEFSPIERAPDSRKVVQQIEMQMEPDEGQADDDDAGRYLMTNIISENFRLLLSAPQTSAKLNWWPAEDGQHDGGEPPPPMAISSSLNDNGKSFLIGQERRKLLEESLLREWLNEKNTDHDEQTKVSNLVNIISRHMSEFVDNYNAYQAELRQGASFANDWHQNWLFAYKRHHWQRCNDDDDDQAGAAGRPGAGRDEARSCSSGPKQARMMTPTGAPDRNNNIQHELINYSTLIVGNRRPRVRLANEESAPASQQEDQPVAGQTMFEHLDNCYQAQQEPMYELQSVSTNSSGQVDVCRLFLNDLFADSDTGLDSTTSNEHLAEWQTTSSKKALDIQYETSLNCCMANGRLCFTACGHLFECDNIREIFKNNSSKLSEHKFDKLKELIMIKLRDSIENRGLVSPKNIVQSQTTNSQDRVKFLINLTNVELINKLPVIQFCAKIGGALPIKVSWYKLVDEHGDGEQSKFVKLNNEQTTRSKKIKFRTRGQLLISEPLASLWPLEMHANYDFEYQNEWSSWFRFKRARNDILFEIRDASQQEDYDKIYKCVIENYCSRRECEFSLRRRQQAGLEPEPEPELKPKPARHTRTRRAAAQAERRHDERNQLEGVRLSKPAREGAQEAGRALLRTWSQRTLNRQHPTAPQPNDGRPDNCHQGDDSRQLTNASQQTVGRLSSKAVDEDKFGADFPYHPQNLLRRLEENKYSLSIRSTGATLTRQQRTGGAGTTSADEINFSPESLKPENSGGEHELSCNKSTTNERQHRQPNGLQAWPASAGQQQREARTQFASPDVEPRLNEPELAGQVAAQQQVSA